MELEEACLQIISFSGDGKSSAYEALAAAKKGSYDEARELLDQASTSIRKAHEVQFRLIHHNAQKRDIAPTLLLIHAMDILMTAMSERDLITHLIDILEEELCE